MDTQTNLLQHLRDQRQARLEAAIADQLTDTYVLRDGTLVPGQAVSNVLAELRRRGWTIGGTLAQFEDWVHDNATTVTTVYCRSVRFYRGVAKPMARCKAVVLRETPKPESNHA